MNSTQNGSGFDDEKGTGQVAAGSGAARDAIDDTLARSRTAKHLTTRSNSRDLTRSSTERKRPAPKYFEESVQRSDSKSDDKDEIQILESDSGKRKGVANRTLKKRKDIPVENDEDNSYKPGIQHKTGLKGGKAVNQSGRKRTRSKPSAEEQKTPIPRWKQKTLHPEGADMPFYKEQAKDHRRELKAQEAELRQKDKEIEQLRGEKADLQSQLKAMDDEIIRPGSEHEVSRTDDSIVRHELEGLAREWKDWASDWSYDGLLVDKLPEQSKSNLAKLFIGGSSSLNGAHPVSPELFAKLLTAPGGAALLLHTFLAHSICDCILTKPFLLLLGLGNEDNTGDEFSVLLTKISKSISEADEAAGRYWRAQTLKLLDGSIKNLGTVLEQDSADDFDARKDRFCTSLAQQIGENETIQGLYLLRSIEEAKKRQDELIGIVRKAVSLFARLWLEEVVIHTWGQSTKDMQRPFCNNDSTMSAHPVMRLKPDDTSLDGQKILAIVQPAIVVMELRSPKSQHFEKIWLRAIVYVSIQGRPPPSQASVKSANGPKVVEG